MCNKLANRHVRVGLADPSDVPRCDICESGPGMSFFFLFLFLKGFSTNGTVFEVHLFHVNSCAAFFYCEIDGSSLCLQCDMSVHVGGKRKHGRYLMLRQRVEVFDSINNEDC